jgi:hypothetical protein
MSTRSIGAWESGRAYPDAEHLQRLVALYLERGAFTDGQEAEEATALWGAALRKAAHRLAPFDPRWFAALRRDVGSGVSTPTPSEPRAAVLELRQDWGGARGSRATRAHRGTRYLGGLGV